MESSQQHAAYGIQATSRPKLPQPTWVPIHQRQTSQSGHNPTGRIPQPRNAFFLFRCDFVRQKLIPRSVEKEHRNISRIVGAIWRSMTDSEKTPWVSMAKHEKRFHSMIYPDYIFTRAKSTRAPTAKPTGKASLEDTKFNMRKSGIRRRDQDSQPDAHQYAYPGSQVFSVPSNAPGASCGETLFDGYSHYTADANVWYSANDNVVAPDTTFNHYPEGYAKISTCNDATPFNSLPREESTVDASFACTSNANGWNVTMPMSNVREMEYYGAEHDGQISSFHDVRLNDGGSNEFVLNGVPDISQRRPSCSNTLYVYPNARETMYSCPTNDTHENYYCTVSSSNEWSPDKSEGTMSHDRSIITRYDSAYDAQRRSDYSPAESSSRSPELTSESVLDSLSVNAYEPTNHYIPHGGGEYPYVSQSHYGEQSSGNCNMPPGGFGEVHNDDALPTGSATGVGNHGPVVYYSELGHGDLRTGYQATKGGSQ